MNRFDSISPLSMVLGTVIASSVSLVHADQNPFAYTSLTTAQVVAANEAGEGKCGEARCGAKMFEKMDTDKDGKISKSEFEAHMDTMFRHKDANGDGSISKDEMHAAMSRKHHEGQCGANKTGTGNQ